MLELASIVNRASTSNNVRVIIQQGVSAITLCQISSLEQEDWNGHQSCQYFEQHVEEQREGDQAAPGISAHFHANCIMMWNIPCNSCYGHLRIRVVTAAAVTAAF